MKDGDIIAFLGFMPPIYKKEFCQLLREICIEREYFNKSEAKKLKFYRFAESDFERLTDGQKVMLEILKSGKKWQPEIASLFLDFMEVVDSVNLTYNYGDMSEETRNQYVQDISNKLGNKFIKIDLSKPTQQPYAS